MRIGVMSDTHGNLALMQRAADRMIDDFAVEVIVHLGDDCSDAREMDARGVRLVFVPGMYESAWADSSVPHRVVEEFGGFRFLISHTPTKDGHDFPGDINPNLASSKYSCDVLLHGHTHRYRAVELEDGLIVINPGHMKSEEDRGAPASFAIIDAMSQDLKVEFYDMAGNLIDAANFVRGGSR